MRRPRSAYPVVPAPAHPGSDFLVEKFPPLMLSKAVKPVRGVKTLNDLPGDPAEVGVPIF